MTSIFLHNCSLASSPLPEHTDGIAGLWSAWLNSSAENVWRPGTLDSLRDALIASLRSLAPTPNTPLILATTKGDIDAEIAWIRQQDGPNPTHTPAPTLAAFTEDLAQRAGLTAPTTTLSTACSSGLVALIDAALTLLDNPATTVIAAGFDFAGDFVHDGFSSLKALTTTCRPFDKNRTGLTLGSAAAACLLSTTASPIRLAGWGLASDATHMTAPDRNAKGLIRAMQNALHHAHLQPADIDLVFAHGTGTRYNDAMESTAFSTLFPQNAARRPAITAVKGLIGHTLGASGLIESLLAARILTEQRIPPITGLQDPEYPHLDLVQDKPRPARIRHLMKVASGFGGLNVALILSTNN